MKKVLKVLAGVVVALIVLVLGFYAWASVSTSRALSTTYTAHTVDFPIPFPVAPEEVAALGLDEAAARQLAQDRAVERGRHLVNARYVCTACHGGNFGGGVMIDAFPIGSLLAPNLTTGQGSRTLDYKASDWDHIVRHGILPDGKPAVMPSDDFQMMSDQELSDVVTYIRTAPPVDNTVPKPALGPLGKVLVATGQIRLSAVVIPSHTASHLVLPPAAEVSLEFGSHLAGVCTGCHGPALSGGPIPGGDPSWPPARNLTPDPTGLGGWSYEQFVHALQESQRPDGTALRAPMTEIAPYAKSMTDVELQALWAYLRSIPPVATAAN